MKQLIVFDLDGTLAVSKSALDSEMVALFGRLLQRTKVAVISGGDWPQFEKQILGQIIDSENLENLYLLPTCGTKFYRYSLDLGAQWQEIYADNLSSIQKTEIIAALEKATVNLGIVPPQVWGDVIEDRGSQITFSALGQEAPNSQKQIWDPDFAIRKRIQELLYEFIPGYSIRLGGTTSIDITKQGVDKAYGIAKLEEIVKIDRSQMLFVGDALFPGGNDFAVKEAGVASIAVRDPNETKRIIEAVLVWSTP